MPLENRAPQFAPFAALTGFDEMVDETVRLTCEKHELTEEQKIHIGEKIKSALEKKNTVNITYFEADLKKSGGAYISAAFTPLKLDSYNDILVTKEGISIRLEDIYKIEDI